MLSWGKLYGCTRTPADRGTGFVKPRAEAGGGEVSAAPQGPPQIVHLIGWSPKTVSMSMLSSARARSPAPAPAAAVSSHEIYGFEKLPVTIGFSSAIVKIETYLSYRHKIAASHCSNFPVWTLVFSWWKHISGLNVCFWNHPNNYLPLTADDYEYIFTNISNHNNIIIFKVIIISMVLLLLCSACINTIIFSFLRSCITFSWHAPVYLLSQCRQQPAPGCRCRAMLWPARTVKTGSHWSYHILCRPFLGRRAFFPVYELAVVWWRTEHLNNTATGWRVAVVRSIKIVPRLAAVVTHTQERG